MLRVLDLFSGIGGFSLGLERTGGFETVAFCEINPSCRAILNRHWPKVPCFDDIAAIKDFPSADIVCGGFPCQDISRAGEGAGLSGARSGLFWELVRAVCLVRPSFVILENVANLIHRGMGEVVGALASCGHDTEWDCIPAYSVGSPQERDRIWIVAYPNKREQSRRGAQSIRRRLTGAGESEIARLDPHANSARELQPGWCFRYLAGRPVHRGQGSDAWRENWRDRLMSFCGMVDGVSRRLDEAQRVGNAVLPQIPELIGRAILAAQAMKEAA